MDYEIRVPQEVIVNSDISAKRCSVYLYFLVKANIENVIGFTCDDIVTWCGYIPNYHKGKINDEITQTINYLYKNEYLQNLSFTSGNSFSQCSLNFQKTYNSVNCSIVTFEDIKKIKQLSFNNENKKMSFSVLLLIYLYLKLNQNSNNIKINKTYVEIASEVGISERYISKAIDKLCKCFSIQLNKTNVKFSIYKFVDKNNNVLYIGKSKSLYTRIKQHFLNGHLDANCYKETNAIYYYNFDTQMEMDIYEIYYINKYLPKYNLEFKTNTQDNLSINLGDIEWMFYSLTDNFTKGGDKN